MKVKYVGPNLGATGFEGGGVYEVLQVDELTGALRIIDESGEPEGYLYHPKEPAMLDVSCTGAHFEIVEDDEQGSLYQAIHG